MVASCRSDQGSGAFDLVAVGGGSCQGFVGGMPPSSARRATDFSCPPRKNRCIPVNDSYCSFIVYKRVKQTLQRHLWSYQLRKLAPYIVSARRSYAGPPELFKNHLERHHDERSFRSLLAELFEVEHDSAITATLRRLQSCGAVHEPETANYHWSISGMVHSRYVLLTAVLPAVATGIDDEEELLMHSRRQANAWGLLDANEAAKPMIDEPISELSVKQSLGRERSIERLAGSLMLPCAIFAELNPREHRMDPESVMETTMTRVLRSCRHLPNKEHERYWNALKSMAPEDVPMLRPGQMGIEKRLGDDIVDHEYTQREISEAISLVKMAGLGYPVHGGLRLIPRNGEVAYTILQVWLELGAEIDPEAAMEVLQGKILDYSKVEPGLLLDESVDVFHAVRTLLQPLRAATDRP